VSVCIKKKTNNQLASLYSH